MSFLELSLSYVYAKPKSRLDDALLHADRLVVSANALPYSKRKVILKSNLILLAGLAVFYIYLSGSIVGGNVVKINKAKALASASRELERVQAELLSADMRLRRGFFEEMGFVETKNLNVIKRTDNVATKAEINQFQ